MARKVFAAPAKHPGRLTDFAFSGKNEAAQRAAALNAAKMVTNVSNETREAIRATIVRSIRDGIPPRDAAKIIQGNLGLNTKQAQAVMNYRATLVKTGLPLAKIEAKVQKYADKKLKERAKLITRTETMAALNQGRLAAAEQAIQEGYLSPLALKEFQATPDEKLCEFCAPFDEQKVPIKEVFRADDREIYLPPVHPRCRCSVAILPPEIPKEFQPIADVHPDDMITSGQELVANSPLPGFEELVSDAPAIPVAPSVSSMSYEEKKAYLSDRGYIVNNRYIDWEAKAYDSIVDGAVEALQKLEAAGFANGASGFPTTWYSPYELSQLKKIEIVMGDYGGQIVGNTLGAYVSDTRTLVIPRQWTNPDSLATIFREMKSVGFIVETAEGMTSVLAHEMGHALSLSRTRLPDYWSKVAFQIRVEGALEQLGTAELERIARKVSKYAATQPAEFVAETIHGLANGQVFDDEVMRLFHTVTQNTMLRVGETAVDILEEYAKKFRTHMPSRISEKALAEIRAANAAADAVREAERLAKFSHSSAGGIREKTPSIGYHMTDPENLESIAESGLKPFGPRVMDDPGVAFRDKLYPIGHEAAMEALDEVTLMAKIPSSTKVFDDQEVRDFLGIGGGPNSKIGVNTSFILPGQGISPDDIFVVEKGTRRLIPLKEYVETERLATRATSLTGTPIVESERLAALREYQNGAGLNIPLREGRTLSALDTKQFDHLDVLTSSHKTDAPITLYRGVNPAFVSELETRAVFMDPGFVSTSRSAKVVEGFGGMTIEIKVPQGVGAVDVNALLGAQSRYSWQEEVLLQRDLKFRVVYKTEKRMVLEIVDKDTALTPKKLTISNIMDTSAKDAVSFISDQTLKGLTKKQAEIVAQSPKTYNVTNRRYSLVKFDQDYRASLERSTKLLSERPDILASRKALQEKFGAQFIEDEFILDSFDSPYLKDQLFGMLDTSQQMIDSGLTKLKNAGYDVSNMRFRFIFSDAEATNALYNTGIIEINLGNSNWETLDTWTRARKRTYASSWHSTGEIDSTIVHEFGHYLHHNSGMVTFIDTSVRQMEFRQSLEIAKKVSRYAATNYKEFVAETFTGLVNGKTYPKDVMDLYWKYGGPKVNV